jgi:Leucine-rich repeat (LRR) protein
MDSYQENQVYSSIRQGYTELPQIPADVLAVDVRRNKISQISLEHIPQIEYLDISDNLIRSIGALSGLSRLTVLDAAYNLLSRISPLDLPSLKELYLMSNDILEIEHMNFKNLEKLDMANNNIKKIENLKCLQLKELYLGANKIIEIENIRHLSGLKILDLQFNAIETVDCAELPRSLEILLLQGNSNLHSIKNLDFLENLKILGIKNTKLAIKSEKINIW